MFHNIIPRHSLIIRIIIECNTVSAVASHDDLGVFTLAKGFDDEGEVEEAEEENVELLEAREDTAEAFEPAEEPLDLIEFRVESAVVLPGLDTVGPRRQPSESTSCRVSSPP